MHECICVLIILIVSLFINVNLTTLLCITSVLAHIVSVSKQKTSTIRKYLLVKIEIDPDLSMPSGHNSGFVYDSSITGGWPTFTLVFCGEQYSYELYK